MRTDLDKYNLCEHCALLQYEHVGPTLKCLFSSTTFVKRKRRTSEGALFRNREGTEVDYLVPLRRLPPDAVR